MMDDFLQLCAKDQFVNDVWDFFDTRPERREEGWYIDLKFGFRFKIKDLGNGDILFCRPKTLDPRNVQYGRIKGKKFQTLVDAPVYNINKIGPKELFNRFQDFIRLSIEEEFPDVVQQIRDKVAQENLNHNRHNSRGHN